MHAAKALLFDAATALLKALVSHRHMRCILHFIFCILYFISSLGFINPNAASSLRFIVNFAAFAGDTSVMLCGSSHGILSSCEIVRVMLDIFTDFTF